MPTLPLGDGRQPAGDCRDGASRRVAHDHLVARNALPRTGEPTPTSTPLSRRRPTPTPNANADVRRQPRPLHDEVVVVAGDSFWSIAVDEASDARRRQLLAGADRGESRSARGSVEPRSAVPRPGARACRDMIPVLKARAMTRARGDRQRARVVRAHSGWAPPDEDTLAEWRADGVCRAPDECLVTPDRVVRARPRVVAADPRRASLGLERLAHRRSRLQASPVGPARGSVRDGRRPARRRDRGSLARTSRRERASRPGTAWRRGGSHRDGGGLARAAGSARPPHRRPAACRTRR